VITPPHPNATTCSYELYVVSLLVVARRVMTRLTIMCILNIAVFLANSRIYFNGQDKSIFHSLVAIVKVQMVSEVQVSKKCTECCQKSDCYQQLLNFYKVEE
jgi:hypothetical protein